MISTQSGKTVRAIILTAFMSGLAPGFAHAQGGATVLPPVDVVVLGFPNPCSGELVNLSGRFVFAFYTRTTHATTRTIIKMQGTNLDLENPTKYVSNDEDVFETNTVGATETTREVNSVLIRQGDDPGTPIGGFGDDFKMKTKFHFTTNANGTPTASVDSITFSCM